MRNKSLISCMIHNSIAVICWAILAILFNHWWIALFSLLFMSSVESKYKHYMVCYGCGKHSPYADSYNEALDKAKSAGWTHIANTTKYYCSQCRWAGMYK